MQDACNGMMLCYVWSDVSRPCNESQLRTVNKTCKELMLLDNKHASSSSMKAHKSHKRALRFQAGMKLRYYPLSVSVGLNLS